MTKREQELLKKIEELEARVRLLEARSPVTYEYHYHTNPPLTPLYWPVLPTYPQPFPAYPIVTCGGIGMDVHPAIQA